MTFEEIEKALDEDRLDYLNHFVLPNYYFHLTTAYNILRQSGVEIGKRDFMGTIPMRVS